MRTKPSTWAAFVLVACQSASALAQDRDNRAEEAIELRRAGEGAAAISLLEDLNREHPDNPETLRLLGSSYASEAKYREAITTLQRARVLAPHDRDISLALSRAFLWSGDIGAAQRIAAGIAAIDPANAELPALQAAISAARSGPSARRPGLAVSQSLSSVSTRGRHLTWRATVIAVDVPLGDRWTVTSDADVEDRSGVTDTRLGVRIDRRLGAGANGYVAVTTTLHPDFREDWGLRAGGEALVTPNIALSINLRHADYGATNVTVAEPGVRLQTADGAFSLAIRSINLWAEQNTHQAGWSIRGEAPLLQQVRLIAGAATYPDTEAGITRRVRGGFVGVSIPVSDRITMRAFVDHEKRVRTYSRTGVALSLGWRFGR